jgi:hypothetical protein
VAAFLPARLSRFALPALALLLGTAGLTSAAAQQGKQQQQSQSATTPAAARTPAPTLVVPDVRGQAYVFAKGILEESGFAWRVAGAVNGFPINLVATQSPSPGTRVVDTGAPTIALQLSRNGKYAESGVPENFAPYGGTRLVTPAARRSKTAPKKPVVQRFRAVPKQQNPAAKPAQKPQAKKPVSRAKPARKTTPKRAAALRRPVAFNVPNAPKEPLNEMPLPRRARLLGAWLDKNPRPTDANVGYWLYQHAWIVTGAKFGWWRGAEALRVLIAVDGRVISTWGVGASSRAAARSALAEVRAKKGT